MNLALIGVYFAIVILSLVVGIPVYNDRVLESENRIKPDGYHFRYETLKGVQRSEWGQLKPDRDTLQVNGSYRYNLPGSKLFLVKYQADENGYRAKVQILDLIVPSSIPLDAIISITGGGKG